MSVTNRDINDPAKIDKLVADAEAAKDEPNDSTPPAQDPPSDPPADNPPKVDPPAEPPKVDPETPPTEPPANPPAGEVKPPVTPPKTPTQDEVDYKSRYAASTREAQVLYSKNKEISQAYLEAEKLAEPTEEEMKTKLSDWETMTSTEQMLARDNELNKRKFAVINKAMASTSTLDTWLEKVDDFAGQEAMTLKFPRLAGREAEFRAFCMQPTRINMSLEDAASAFSWEIKETPSVNKGKALFNQPNGGDGAPPKLKADEYTAEQASQLRTTNPKKYNELAAQGKINVVVE